MQGWGEGGRDLGEPFSNVILYFDYLDLIT